MVSRSVDPDTIAAVVRALDPLRERVADADDDLIALVPDPGDPATRIVVDGFVDAALDACRAVGEEARMEALALRNAALAPADADADAARRIRERAR